jgi:ribonuclease HI
LARIVENALVIYTDGSLFPKGRRGGFGILFVHFDHVGNETVVDDHAPPGVAGTTNNRMELQAVITALRRAPDISCYASVDKVLVRTDSQYVSNNHKNAINYWSRQKWESRDGRPIDNADLWKDFIRAFRAMSKRTEIEWVKGHAKGKQKDPYNAAADKLARSAAQSPLSRPTFRSSVRRKTTTERTRVGSIPALGQVMVVRVVEVLWMRVQKIWKYRCEVVSPPSHYVGKLDWLFSELQLRDGHYYEVQMNDDPAKPTITALLRELNVVDLAP